MYNAQPMSSYPLPSAQPAPMMAAVGTSRRTVAQPAAKPRRSIIDSVSFYRQQSAEIPLLDRDQELQLAKQIYRFRLAFQRQLMKQTAVAQFLIEKIEAWNRGDYRIDRLCDVALNSRQDRDRIEPRLATHAATIKRLLAKRQIAFEQKDRQTVKRINWKLIRLFEELSIRPSRWEEAPFTGALAHFLLDEYKRRCRQMAAANLRLVFSVAHQICGTRPILADMLQEGNRGLMRAVVKFDYRRGLRFSTYATLWIRQSIFNAIGNFERNIQLPSNFNSTMHRIRRDANEQVGEVSADKVAKSVNVSPLEADRLLRVLEDTQSLDDQHPNSAIKGTLGSMIPDQQSIPPIQMAQRRELADRVDQALQHLTPRQREVMELRFGLVDGVDRSMAEVGRQLGITRERVRQVHREALQLMAVDLGLPPPE